MKLFISGYRFPSEKEEIEFFKEIKPDLFRHLLYYRKVYNIEMNRPVGTAAEQVEYLSNELKLIQAYACKRLDFYRYVRSGATHLDRKYFLRGKTARGTQYLDSFSFERDPAFSTQGDFHVAKIYANDMLSVRTAWTCIDSFIGMPVPSKGVVCDPRLLFPNNSHTVIIQNCTTINFRVNI